MSVSWGTQYSKLKTNLRLAANRLRLLQKKKTEQAVKARCEIADFLSSDKEDRARIRVETIIREDFVVEAYELLEMYCELLLARFGIIQQMKELDDGIAEAVSSLLWVAPRIGHEIAEFKVINDELTHKYGKQFAEAARMNQLPEPSRVSPKLVAKLSVSAPSKLLVEKYLITIAQSAGIDFTPDAKVMREDDDEIARAERNLINFMNEEQYGWRSNNSDEHNGAGGKGSGGGGGHFAVAAADPLMNMPTPPARTSDGGVVAKSSSALSPHPPPRAAAFAPPFAPPHASPPPEYAPPPPPPSHQQPQHYNADDASNRKLVIAGGSVYPSVHSASPAATPILYPNDTAMQRFQQDGENVGPPTSEHIYEMPQDRDNDFLLPKLPDPPSHVPMSFASNGGGSRTNAVPPPVQHNNPNQDLDFDTLAKRFEELKKRL